jgi:CrcB protein
MPNVVYVAIGGALGAVVRYFMAAAVQSACPGFKPLGTMLVNILGCLLVGMAMTWIVRSNAVGAPIQFFVVTGILGGFTTFSAFGYETVSLMQEKQLAGAFWNIVGNLGVGLPAVVLGQYLVEWFRRCGSGVEAIRSVGFGSERRDSDARHLRVRPCIQRTTSKSMSGPSMRLKMP